MRSDNRSDSQNKKEIKACCFLFFAFILGLGLIAAIISYVVFGIISLVENYNISKDCKGSNLWEYVLVSIILSLNLISIKSTSDKNIDLSACVIVLIAIIELGLAIWGGNEIYKYSCNNLNNTLLWKVALASFIKQVFVAFMVVVGVPVCLIIYSCDDCFKNSNSLREREYENNLDSQNNTNNNTENNTDLTEIIIEN